MVVTHVARHCNHAGCGAGSVQESIDVVTGDPASAAAIAVSKLAMIGAGGGGLDAATGLRSR